MTTRRILLGVAAAAVISAKIGRRAWAAELRNAGSKNEVLFRTLGRTREKVSMVGIGGYHLGKPGLAIRYVGSLRAPFSSIHRDIAVNEIPWCNAHQTGVICYSPMQSGLLTDRFIPARVAKMAKNDWRRAHSGVQSTEAGTQSFAT